MSLTVFVCKGQLDMCACFCFYLSARDASSASQRLCKETPGWPWPPAPECVYNILFWFIKIRREHASSETHLTLGVSAVRVVGRHMSQLRELWRAAVSRSVLGPCGRTFTSSSYTQNKQLTPFSLAQKV